MAGAGTGNGMDVSGCGEFVKGELRNVRMPQECERMGKRARRKQKNIWISIFLVTAWPNVINERKLCIAAGINILRIVNEFLTDA